MNSGQKEDLELLIAIVLLVVLFFTLVYSFYKIFIC